jgi:class 3 adenylate cyclase
MAQEQPVRVGRRLAAIVAADVAGYSRLMGLDEVGTARALREHRRVTGALVAKHGGCASVRVTYTTQSLPQSLIRRPKRGQGPK